VAMRFCRGQLRKSEASLLFRNIVRLLAKPLKEVNRKHLGFLKIYKIKISNVTNLLTMLKEIDFMKFIVKEKGFLFVKLENLVRK